MLSIIPKGRVLAYLKQVYGYGFLEGAAPGDLPPKRKVPFFPGRYRYRLTTDSEGLRSTRTGVWGCTCHTRVEENNVFNGARLDMEGCLQRDLCCRFCRWRVSTVICKWKFLCQCILYCRLVLPRTLFLAHPLYAVDLSCTRVVYAAGTI